MKQIPGFTNYFVTTDGKVFSEAMQYRQKEKKLRRLSLWKCAGYWAVHLTKDGIQLKRLVHRLVLETFVGQSPDGYQCRHLNGDRSDNRLENLRWGTRSENQMDRLLHGTSNNGERHPNNKLTSEQVLEIRRLAASNNKKTRQIDRGGDYKNIAAKFNVSPSTVGSIVSRKTWGRLP